MLMHIEEQIYFDTNSLASKPLNSYNYSTPLAVMLQ